MRIKRIEFNNIKNFTSSHKFDFSETRPLTTISGKNGSGKTTIFKSLVLCQKAFFISQLEGNELIHYKDVLSAELSKFFRANDSFITITLAFPDELDFEYSFTIHCIEYFHEKVRWGLRCEKEILTEIKKYWNFQNPSEIIVYIDSDKHFFEGNVSHENISVKTTTSNQLIIDTVLNPERLFSSIYQNLINDYLKERLVPAKPKRDIYFLTTKILLKYLLPSIEIANFSGQEFQNQFVLLAKTSSTNKSVYDIRNFSSGEKTLFYIILYINYVQRIGLLIIDEPENHFHEELLVRFIKTLNEICLSKDYITFLKDTAKKVNFYLGATSINQINKYYQNHNLSQVFLLTHSKNLIYNNFLNGSNYYLDKSLKNIDYDNFEKTLREIGLSSIYSKVLFVEGTSETEYFDLFFNDFNIKIHPLDGCKQVIDTYRKILEIKNHLKDYHFCFLIDRDTRTEDEIDTLREKNSNFFDEHFIVLNRHEFENFLLDAKLFKDIIDKYASSYKATLTIEQIDDKLFEIATKEKIHVIKKTVQNKNWEVVNTLKSKLIKKDAPFESLSDYETYVETLLKDVDVSSLIKQKFVANFKKFDDLVSKDWDSKWIELCDGKIALSKSLDYFSNYLDLKKNRFANEMKNFVLNSSKTYEVKRVISDILSRFQN